MIIAGRPVSAWVGQSIWLLVLAAAFAVFLQLNHLPAGAGASSESLLLPAEVEASPQPSAIAPAAPKGPVMLQLDRPMSHGDYVWSSEGVPAGRVDMLVDIGTQTIHVFRSGFEIGRAVILYGTEENPTPLGKFTITQKKIDHESNLYEAQMPWMMRLTNDGIAIHGTIVEYGKASRGCIGVPDEFAALLFEQAKLGDQVRIINSDRASAAAVSTVS